MKRFFSILCAAILLVMNFSFNIYADDVSEGYAVLSGETPETKNMKAGRKGEDLKTGSRGGEQGWILSSSDSTYSSILIRLDDSFVSSNNDGSSFEIDVEYFDEGKGFFSLFYEGRSDNGYSDTAYTNRRNIYKTHTFVIDDAKFAKGLTNSRFGKYDFCLTTETNLGNSETDILIKKITVRRYSGKSSVDISAGSEEPGNIFSDNEDLIFNIKFSNVLRTNVSFDVLYEAVSRSDNEVKWSNSESFVLSSRKTASSVVKIGSDISNGNYILRITASNNSKLNATKEVPFSKVMHGEKNNSFLYNVHFNKYASGGGIESVFELIEKSNAGGYRDHPIGWDEFEPQENTENIPDYLSDVLKGQEKYKFKGSLNTLAFGNPLYTGSAESPPITENALSKWGSFGVKLIGKTGAERVEVWNEPNWGPYVSPENYVEMVKSTVKAAKEYSKNIEVCAGSIAEPFADGTGKNYFNDLIAAGLLKCDIDAISIHFYDSSLIGENLVSRVKYYRDILDKNGRSDIDIWITEYGWYTGTYGKSEKNQAEIAVKQYLLLKGSGVAENIMYYQLVDSMPLHTNSDNQLGTVDSNNAGYAERGAAFAAKKSFCAISAMNALTANMKSKTKSVKINENTFACQFSNESDTKSTVALWADDNRNVIFSTDKSAVDIYDIYGNKSTLKSDTGVFNISVSGEIVYLSGDLGDYIFGYKPVEISSYEDLASFRDRVNSGEKELNAKLKGDIDISSEGNWQPISGFSGTFDGNGHKIFGFGIWSDLAGFFRNAGAATIKNLIIEGSVNGVNFSAGIIGGNEISGDISIENCLFIGNVTGSYASSGICFNGAVKNCGVIGDVTGTGDVGGIGLNTKAENCFVFGTVKATDGAAAGVSNDSGTSNSYYRETTGSFVGYGTKKAAESFASGEVAYLLGDAFGQKLGTDICPMLKKDDNGVYCSEADGTYSTHSTVDIDYSLNNSELFIYPPFNIIGKTVCIALYNENGSLEDFEIINNVNAEKYIETKLNLKKATDNVCDIRIFTFNDLIDIKPVSKKKIIKKGE